MLMFAKGLSNMLFTSKYLHLGAFVQRIYNEYICHKRETTT